MSLILNESGKCFSISWSLYPVPTAEALIEIGSRIEVKVYVSDPSPEALPKFAMDKKYRVIVIEEPE